MTLVRETASPECGSAPRRSAASSRRDPGPAAVSGCPGPAAHQGRPERRRMIRVLLADDQVLVRAGFRAFLATSEGIEVVGEAGDGEEAVRLARQLVPDVVLMDIRMPGKDGLTATQRIAADDTLAGVRVVILTTFDLDEYVFEALRGGASGFLVKDTEPVELVKGVRPVARGDALLSPGVTRRPIAQFAAHARQPHSVADLTRRRPGQAGVVVGAHRQTEAAAGMRVQRRGEVERALVVGDVGQVPDPASVGPPLRRGEVPPEHVRAFPHGLVGLRQQPPPAFAGRGPGRAAYIKGATVLGIGGGVGEIEVELVRAGAARAQILELSPAYEEQARRLAAAAGVGERVDWRIHDIAEDPHAVAPADVVVMNRVVCCYPDYERLLSAAADHARRALVFSHPRRNAAVRAFYVVFNLVMRMMRSDFRGFAHPPRAMRAVLERRGLQRTYEQRGLAWQVAGHERLPASMAGSPEPFRSRLRRGRLARGVNAVRAGQGSQVPGKGHVVEGILAPGLHELQRLGARAAENVACGQCDDQARPVPAAGARHEHSVALPNRGDNVLHKAVDDGGGR
jgi:DNA-binding NarL/FixJ family response regulator/2-polyprenyl-3-methyl-5-hydroxy-6-metoxy-1,4-benzoquinol methylase